MEKIAVGAAAACGDCAFEALAQGAQPLAIVHLGGEAIDDAR